MSALHLQSPAGLQMLLYTQAPGNYTQKGNQRFHKQCKQKRCKGDTDVTGKQQIGGQVVVDMVRQQGISSSGLLLDHVGPAPTRNDTLV